MRPNSYLTTDATIYYDLTTYDVDGLAIDADSTPTVSYRVGTNDTLATAGVSISKVSATTGLYKVEIDLGDVTSVNGASVRFEESAIINGETYVNRWATFVRDESTGYTPTQIAAQVWNSLTASFNVGGSFGKAIRQMKEGLIVEESSVNDASATTSAFITNLISSVDDFYSDDTLVFISGSLTGQSRIISDYNGTTKAVTFDETWTSAPADSDEFILLAGHNLTLTQIQNQIWNAATSDHQTAGTTGKALTDAGGGSSSVVVYPIQSVTPQRTNETTLKAYLNETVSFTVLPVDADGDPVDTTGMTLAVVVEDRQTTDVETITDASITKTATSYTFSTSTSNTTLGQKRWSCRNTANANVISTGQYVVTYAPE